MGRYINADNAEFLGATGTLLGYNLFAYCENNPVNKYAPTGMDGVALYISTPLLAQFIAWLGIVAAADWWNPIGWVIVGVLAVGAVTWAALSLYRSYKVEVIQTKNKIPTKLLTKDGRVDIAKLSKKGPLQPKSGRSLIGPLGYQIIKDMSHHKGSIWKLLDSAGIRIASLAADGTIVGK